MHSAMVYVIQVCRQLSSRTKMVLLGSCLQICMTYTIAECTVKKVIALHVKVYFAIIFTLRFPFFFLSFRCSVFCLCLCDHAS